MLLFKYKRFVAISLGFGLIIRSVLSLCGSVFQLKCDQVIRSQYGAFRVSGDQVPQVPQPTCFWTYQSQARTLSSIGAIWNIFQNQ